MDFYWSFTHESGRKDGRDIEIKEIKPDLEYNCIGKFPSNSN